MPPAAPQFPAFDDWKNLSERDQDALLDSMEAHKRRSRLVVRLLIGIACLALALATGIALLAMR